MNAKCPECNSDLIAYRLVRCNGELIEEECEIIVKNENCLRSWNPLNAIQNKKPFSVYCTNEKCYYRIMDTMDVLQSKKLGKLTVSGNMCYTMGRG
jgi:uncharacterized protein YbaR (Trm112 family)